MARSPTLHISTSPHPSILPIYLHAGHRRAREAGPPAADLPPTVPARVARVAAAPFSAPQHNPQPPIRWLAAHWSRMRVGVDLGAALGPQSALLMWLLLPRRRRGRAGLT